MKRTCENSTLDYKRSKILKYEYVNAAFKKVC